MKPITREEFSAMLEKARVTKRLQKELRFVPEEISDWQDRDFLAVCNRSRSEGVLLAPFFANKPIPFRLQARRANAQGRSEAIICDICATWQRGAASASITFQKQKGSVSFLCCDDLACSLHVRDKTPAAKLSRTQLREDVTREKRIARLRGRLEFIAKSVDA